MTIDEELSALMDRFFRAVSFGAGETPAYERLHDLFTPAGRLINAIGDALDDTTVAGFVEPRRVLVDAGVLTSFEEVETGIAASSVRCARGLEPDIDGQWGMRRDQWPLPFLVAPRCHKSREPFQGS